MVHRFRIGGAFVDRMPADPAGAVALRSPRSGAAWSLGAEGAA